ncbi:mitochondrial TIM23 translocase of inner membrane Tim17 subunit (core translocase) [Andalucia godoyi]|uniref:Mitochondrial TIM23 translocase of inner membrane Tim17 subunit (Core translocase) n=1 Tax=Andalucia godoyi TaxID=505711 RepID=A0A8K0AHS2_ANDGO|nr:mitochondrial TIM23 translocase of inner membrane Tim17 subunit (core translocase) [Andalucia godoyi]|eukprot:ANDGO_06599.mRNA.1 mitochondrial TIM23 translocase of inner membrane Tim17 subunit (core translocase)
MSLGRHSDPSRPPCPWRIIDDIGGAFAMGAVGSSVVHSFKGARNAPRGYRMQGAIQMAKLRAPIVGGNFAVWGGLFSSFECSLFYMRQKDDIWNPIMAGAATGGVLAIRGGFRAAASSAVIGGVLLAMIEGMTSLISKYSADQMRKMQEMQEAEALKARDEQLKQKATA